MSKDANLEKNKIIAQQYLHSISKIVAENSTEQEVDVSEIANIMLLINQLFCETLLQSKHNHIRLLGCVYGQRLEALIRDIYKKYTIQGNDHVTAIN